MLKIENLVKDYSTGFFSKKVRVLRGVNFNVTKGEVFGFIGPNGAGKTTTFKSILGFVGVTSGTIKIFDVDNNDVAVKSKIGYLPESPYFYDYLTGEELLNFMGQLHGVPRDILTKRVDILLEKVNMGHARKVQLRKYSKGMLQRIGIAQSLINDPDFLILDEPMSGLDPIGRREIKEIIIEQKELGKTVLLSSHILSDVESLCDRVGVILNGNVVKIGVLAELFDEIETDYEIFLNCKRENIEGKINIDDIFLDERAGFVIARFHENQKNKVIDSILKENIEIISLYPLRKSLEGLFEEEQSKITN
ncbi:MAG: ABC transporter ATP-binding protein [Thermodesulfobacteriota bacterium]